MDDETRAILVGFGLALKQQANDLGALQRSFQALYSAILEAYPALATAYTNQAPVQAPLRAPETFAQVDELLKQLRKEQV